VANTELVRRLKDYFARQEAYCCACLVELETFPQDVEVDTLDAIFAKHRLHAEGRAALEDELAALRVEWQGARPTDAEREEVRKASSGAEKLADELAARNVAWKKWVDERMAALTGEIAGLRRGRAEIGRYDSSRDTDATYIDEKI
jgi:uncharacterized small protein (DUF1192 family)